MSVDIGTYRMRVGMFCYYQMCPKGIQYFTQFELLCWLSILLILSGDVHQNPGPEYSSTSQSSSSFSDILSSNLKIVHYNIQSFLNKKDILYADLHNFDVLSFTETWLKNSDDTVDLIFPSFHTPYRVVPKKSTEIKR